jgi:hypothetical protein
MLNFLSRTIQREEQWLKRENEQRAEARRKSLEFDGRTTGTAPVAAPTAAPARMRTTSTEPLPADASPEEKILQELEDAAAYPANLTESIETLRPVVEAQRRAPRLAVVQELFDRLDVDVRTALSPPEPMKVTTFDELMAGTGERDTATRVCQLVAASAFNHDVTVLLEEQPALVTEAMNLNVMRLRGMLQRNNFVLASTRFALEGRQNPHARTTPTIERSWEHLLRAARGDS